MILFEKTLKRLDEFCERESINYAVIGGVAVITYDYHRTTKDVDITVLCKLEDLDKIHDKFLKEYQSIYQESLNFFTTNFVLPLIDTVTKVKIDVAAGLTMFDDLIIKRKKRIKLGEVEFYICTMEDLVIYKLFAGRHLDFGDVEMLLKRNKNLLDQKYLFETAEKFKELEREDILENLNKLLKQ